MDELSPDPNNTVKCGVLIVHRIFSVLDWIEALESDAAEPIIHAAWNAALSLIKDQKKDYCSW